jgi:hypothetical protein
MLSQPLLNSMSKFVRIFYRISIRSDCRLTNTYSIEIVMRKIIIYKKINIYFCKISSWSVSNYIKELCPSVRRSFRGRSAVTPLGDKTSFGPPFIFCVLELSRKSPCLWACFHSLSPLSVVSTEKGNFNTSQYEMLKLCQTAVLSQPNPIR